MHEGPGPGLFQGLDVAVGERHRGVGQRQAADALLRAGGPAVHTRVVVNPEVLDPQRRHRVDQAHDVVLFTGGAEARDVVDPARSGFPMCHCGPLGLVLGQCGLDHAAGHGHAVRHIDDDDRGRFRVQRVERQFGGSGGLHTHGQPVDAREGPVGEDHDLVARHHGTEHHVQAAPPGSGDAKGVHVLRAPDLAQHVLALDHATQDVAMHVVGKTRPGISRQHPRVGVAGPGARGDGFGDFELGE